MPQRMRRVPCPNPTCKWEGRTDKLKRHVEYNHTRHSTKERKVYFADDEKLMGKIRQCKAYVEEYKKQPEFDKKKIGHFGDFVYLFGNLTHINVRKMVVRKHYNWMNIQWAETVDGITTSDEMWKEWFVQNIDRFADENVRWGHFLTSDSGLYTRLPRGDKVYKVIEGHCACICNEVAKTPLCREEVDSLIQRKAWHYHFLVQCETKRFPNMVSWVQSYLSNSVEDPFCKPAKNGGLITVLDKMRGYHYVHRREASIGLPLHFYIEGTPKFRFAPSGWGDVISRLKMQRPDVMRINNEYARQAHAECKRCRKAASGACHMHRYSGEDVLNEDNEIVVLSDDE